MSGSTSPQSALIEALRRGDPAELRALLDAGADLQGADEDGYTALLRAVHGSKSHLLEVLQLLVHRGAELNGISRYGESALRVLSNAGRFDAVRLLLDAGADESQLAWNPLIRAVALGSLADVQAAWQTLRAAGGSLEAHDRWKRTAWLVALQTGGVAKARWLAEQGADTRARGHCGKPPLFYAIEGQHGPMLHWLLHTGQDVQLTDDFGHTPLMHATTCRFDEGIRLLVSAGAPLEQLDNQGETALAHATRAPQARLLMALGADATRLAEDARRDLLGLPPEPDVALLAGVTPAQFSAARTRRFGRTNGEKMNEPFWLAMIRAGVSAYGALRHFDGQRRHGEPPVWCAQRFGQSISFLPDGRIVQVGGEHEDSYDPDFCIYNDVFEHHPDGRIDIHGYPEDLFPPTDFHTATQLEDELILIGALGYPGQRAFDTTPVFSLALTDFRIRRLDMAGKPPGWIHKHRARLSGPGQITVTDGTVARMGRKEVHEPNLATFVLDLRTREWRPAD